MHSTIFLVFQHDVTAAMLVFQNNETAAMLVYGYLQSNAVRVELLSYVNITTGHESENSLLVLWISTSVFRGGVLLKIIEILKHRNIEVSIQPLFIN